MKPRTDFLFATPSFLAGAARALDIGGVFDDYNYSDHPDMLAVTMDWAVVIDDLEDVFSGVIGDLDPLPGK